MFTFLTTSGTTWQVADGRITRYPSAYLPPEVAYRDCSPIERVPFRWVTPPEEGQQAYFLLAGHTVPSRTGVVTVIDRPDVEARRHEMESAWENWDAAQQEFSDARQHVEDTLDEGDPLVIAEARVRLANAELALVKANPTLDGVPAFELRL